MATVLCEVSNCVFNEESKKCTASEIFVVAHAEVASSKEETDCRTFEPKNV
ncbi:MULTISPECIES: DUF1540 domain-containing protein [Bacillaceae]|uniref:DUF1540 domain-containing protein n=1 Tax=Bacillaceae TaxID=186817 RepID=UPI000A0575EF|nr:MULTISPECIES: DUF1540 domain-containing protein [Bacillaceae]UOE94439.1 DUF1540 domain-containing protein [Alkalihalobacillus sp. LMS39]